MAGSDCLVLPTLPSLAKKAGHLQAVENLVDLVGIEPTTSSMPWKRAPSCATGPLAIAVF